VEPAEEINLHFHGDFSCHHLRAQFAICCDRRAHLSRQRAGSDPDKITLASRDGYKRSRAPPHHHRGTQATRAEHKADFIITAASEIMAIMGLAKDREDLRHRLDAIVVGLNRSGQPVRAAEFHATGSLMALLTDAIMPNLVQTTEGTPATVHIGPFLRTSRTVPVASFRRPWGCSLPTMWSMNCGFGSDLGAEKYFDLVTRYSG